jgi:hypothetical protein
VFRYLRPQGTSSTEPLTKLGHGEDDDSTLVHGVLYEPPALN